MRKKKKTGRPAGSNYDFKITQVKCTYDLWEDATKKIIPLLSPYKKNHSKADIIRKALELVSQMEFENE